MYPASFSPQSTRFMYFQGYLTFPLHILYPSQTLYIPELLFFSPQPTSSLVFSVSVNCISSIALNAHLVFTFPSFSTCTPSASLTCFIPTTFPESLQFHCQRWFLPHLLQPDNRFFLSHLPILNHSLFTQSFIDVERGLGMPAHWCLWEPYQTDLSQKSFLSAVACWNSGGFVN